jgi:hypothetical protein
MRIHIVCYEDVNAWILGKFARKLNENIRDLGIVSNIGKTPDKTADINHHVSYFEYDGSINNIDTLMVTHIDTIQKMNQVRSQLKSASMGICLSMESVNQLVNAGVPRAKLCYISPGHDGVIKPKKATVGICSRVYRDGRKREHFLEAISERVSADVFAFKIMGSGWDKQVDILKKRGFDVEYFNDFIYDEYTKLIPSLDYYLYAGLDEGQMGFIDALAAGIKTIVPPIGYHLDVENGITHPFKELDELLKIFTNIESEWKRYPSLVEKWTWRDYAIKHVEIWRYLVQKKTRDNEEGVYSSYPDGLNTIADTTVTRSTFKTIGNEYKKLFVSPVSKRKRIKNILYSFVPYSVFSWYRKRKKERG